MNWSFFLLHSFCWQSVNDTNVYLKYLQKLLRYQIIVYFLDQGQEWINILQICFYNFAYGRSTIHILRYFISQILRQCISTRLRKSVRHSRTTTGARWLLIGWSAWSDIRPHPVIDKWQAQIYTGQFVSEWR